MVPELSLLLIHIEGLGFYWPNTKLGKEGEATGPLAPPNLPLGPQAQLCLSEDLLLKSIQDCKKIPL